MINDIPDELVRIWVRDRDALGLLSIQEGFEQDSSDSGDEVVSGGE